MFKGRTSIDMLARVFKKSDEKMDTSMRYERFTDGLEVSELIDCDESYSDNSVASDDSDDSYKGPNSITQPIDIAISKQRDGQRRGQRDISPDESPSSSIYFSAVIPPAIPPAATTPLSRSIGEVKFSPTIINDDVKIAKPFNINSENYKPPIRRYEVDVDIEIGNKGSYKGYGPSPPKQILLDKFGSSCYIEKQGDIISYRCPTKQLVGWIVCLYWVLAVIAIPITMKVCIPEICAMAQTLDSECNSYLILDSEGKVPCVQVSGESCPREDCPSDVLHAIQAFVLAILGFVVMILMTGMVGGFVGSNKNIVNLDE